MKGQDPRELFDAFRSILRDATFCSIPDPHRDFDSVRRDVISRVMELPADQLRIIDQNILNSNLNILSDSALDAVATARRAAGLPEISRGDLRADQLNRFAILNPIDLGSVPNPEIRAALIARFGCNSSLDCLRDIFDLDQDERVRAEVIGAANRRLSMPLITRQETSKIIAFGNEVVAAAFLDGRNIEAAHLALAMIRHHPEAHFPDVLERTNSRRWQSHDFAQLSPIDRAGVVRFFGDGMAAPDLLEFIDKERNQAILNVLLQKLDDNWDLGVAPDGYGTEVGRTKVSRFALSVLSRKLGVEDPSPTLLEELLYTDSQPDEPSVYKLLRRLAVRAFRESGM
jgi:hypothetical protein